MRILGRPWRRLLACAWVLPILCATSGSAGDEPEEPGERAERVVRLVKDATRRSPASTSVLAGIDPRRAPLEIRKMVRIIRGIRFDVSLQDQKVEAVLDFLRGVSGLNFALSKNARKELAASDARISLELRDVTLENVLNLMRFQLGDYRFTIRYGTVLLVTREEYRPRRVLRVYDISDIVRPRRDFRAPRLGLEGIVEEP